MGGKFFMVIKKIEKKIVFHLLNKNSSGKTVTNVSKNDKNDKNESIV